MVLKEIQVSLVLLDLKATQGQLGKLALLGPLALLEK